MSALHQAVDNLYQSFANLEEALAQTPRATKKKRKAAQDELFTAQVAANVSARDNALVARRLDGAIETIEKLLAEG